MHDHPSPDLGADALKARRGRDLPEAISLKAKGTIATLEPNALPLFRREAISAKAPSQLPNVIYVRAPYMGATTVGAASVIALIVCICIFVKMTQIVAAPGILIPEKSSIKVFPQRPGVIVHVYGNQGDRVRKGEPLFAVSGELYSDSNEAELQKASDQLKKHISELRESKTLSENQTKELVGSLKLQIDELDIQESIVKRTIVVQQQAVEMDQEVVNRRVPLHSADVVTANDVEKAKEILSDDQSRLMSSMSELQTLRRNIIQLKSDLVQAPLQLAGRLSEFDQQITAIEVQLTKNETDRWTTVNAPADGLIASNTAFLGQNVSSDRAIMVLNADTSPLVAQVLVPSNGIGFVQLGNQVAIKYDAFPYQTFGYYSGHVINIGNVALTPAEIDILKIQADPRVPVFSVSVAIDQQNVETYGRQTPLVAGSTLTANLSGESRYIWQWIFNPLLSVKGDAFSLGKSQ